LVALWHVAALCGNAAFGAKADITQTRLKVRPNPKRTSARDLHLRNGLNVHNGQITCRAVADALKLPYTPADQALHASTNGVIE
jgi:alanine dehydrogenase